jgi:hypothetical protein
MATLLHIPGWALLYKALADKSSAVSKPEVAHVYRHVVGAEARRRIDEFPKDRLARSQRFVVRTSARLAVMIGWLPIWLAVGLVTAMLLLTDTNLRLEPVTRFTVVIAGLFAGLLGWLVWGAVTNADALPDRSNRRSYDALLGRIDEAEEAVELQVVRGYMAADAAPVNELARLKASLDPAAPDGDWASGLGHVNAWRDLHRVEQDVLRVGDDTERQAALERDELRIANSTLDTNGSRIRALLDRGRKGSSDAIVSAHAAIDEFRDTTFETLVRARIRTDAISFLLGMFACALLALAILAGADRTAVIGVSSLYLIGAAAGLFTQLKGGETESSEEVFGYGQAQLRQTVLLSGLAGVAGVFLMAATGAAATEAEVDLADALQFSAISAVTAAAFGLAPGMLTDRVSIWAKSKIVDLETTTTAATK